MDALFESSFSTVGNSEARQLSRCGKCQRFMKVSVSDSGAHSWFAVVCALTLSFPPLSTLTMRKFHPGRPHPRLHCAHCDDTYRLPSNGNVKVYKELKCPMDGFELVICSIPNGRATPVCPYCYNHPPFEGFASAAELQDAGSAAADAGKEDVRAEALRQGGDQAEGGSGGGKKKGGGAAVEPATAAAATAATGASSHFNGMTCNMCPHPTCPHSMIQSAICACPHCGEGAMCLDPVR